MLRRMAPTSPSSDDAGIRSERILVVGTQYIGDTLLAVPFLRNLRRMHPAAVIDVCVAGGARDVIGACPYIDEVIAWLRPAARRSRGIGGLAAQAAWLRARGYTRAYLLKPSLSAAALALLAGIPQRIGFAGESSLLLTRRVRRRRGRHQVETYLDLLRDGPDGVDDAHNENWVTAASARRVDPLLDRLPGGRPKVLLAMRSTDPFKHWDADRWRRLAVWLVEVRGCEIVLCGGPRDRPAHDALRQAVGAEVATHVHDFSTAVPLGDAAALAARMDLCVGVDTGLVHLASSVGVPAVVIVGPTDPNRWSPWRTDSIVLRSCRVSPTLAERFLTAIGATDHLRWPLGRADIADIRFDDVQDAVGRMLERRIQRGQRTVDLTSGSFRYTAYASAVAGADSVPSVPAAAD
jgi:heptosyltransferase II